jgi:hypothetical protein
MSVRTFFENVARPNAQQAILSRDDDRLATNAILSLDAFFGQLYVELQSRGAVREPDDHKFRDTMAAMNPDYELLRDASFSIKHGKLTGRRARLISSADQVASRGITLGDGFFLGHDVLGGGAVFIEHDNGTSTRAEFVISRVLSFCEAQLIGNGL